MHENALICFVVTFTIQQNRPSNIASGYHISAMVYKGLASENFSLDILKLLEQIKSLFPQPESEAQNAIYHLKGKNPGKGLSHWGGLKMGHGDKSIEVRCRAKGKWFVYDEDVRVDREMPGRKDYYGGYRRWKNQYVKNNRPVYEKFKDEYLSGKRSPAIWYAKYPHPEGVQFADPKSLVNWETGMPL